MKNRVITISREFGSGGRTIGKKVAEKLGIPCYDSEIIQEMAKETGFAPDYVKEAGEYAPGSFLSSAFSNRMFGPTNEDILWEHQCNTITALAEKGPCVIVGRCADYILQDKADCLKVFNGRTRRQLIPGDSPPMLRGHLRSQPPVLSHHPDSLKSGEKRGTYPVTVFETISN